MDQTTQHSEQGQQTGERVVGWGPTVRKGLEIIRVPLDGETWSRVQIEGWYRRPDLGDYYQQEEVPGQTVPMVLMVRTRDLLPTEPSAPKPASSAGLQEDLAEALKMAQDMHEALPAVQKWRAAALERRIRGIQAQVGQG